MGKISDRRPQLTFEQAEDAVESARCSLQQRLTQKGFGGWVSRHEILGIVNEEAYELVAAVHRGSEDQVRKELLDVAVAAIWGIASIDAGTLDW